MALFHRNNTRSAKVSATQVLEMRQLYAEGWTQGKLSREYRLSIGQVGRIVRNESWNQLLETPKSKVELARESEELFKKLQKEGLVRTSASSPPPDPFDLELPEDTEGDGLGRLQELVNEIDKPNQALNDFVKGDK